MTEEWKPEEWEPNAEYTPIAIEKMEISEVVGLLQWQDRMIHELRQAVEAIASISDDKIIAMFGDDYSWEDNVGDSRLKIDAGVVEHLCEQKAVSPAQRATDLLQVLHWAREEANSVLFFIDDDRQELQDIKSGAIDVCSL